VERALQKSLEVLGVTVEPRVFLIGRLREGGSGYPLCVEPEDGPIVPADFEVCVTGLPVASGAKATIS
jgi:hypothetical protein